jgi:hypothetical protein
MLFESLEGRDLMSVTRPVDAPPAVTRPVTAPPASTPPEIVMPVQVSPPAPVETPLG